MKDRIFFDTNILVYAYYNQDINKQLICRDLFKTHIGNELYISTQVLNEFYSALYRNKVDFNSIKGSILEIQNTFNVLDLTNSNINKCLHIISKYKFSYWDSLIVAAALQNNCTTLYSEDMQHNQVIENSLTIVNPFIK